MLFSAVHEPASGRFCRRRIAASAVSGYHDRVRTAQPMRKASADSPNTSMLAIMLPTAPIPVQSTG
jgi:hypothetical protein